MLIKSKKSTLGFTLVETLITTVVLTLAAVSLTSFLTSNQYTAQSSLYESTAFTVASSTLEQMKSMPASDLESAINNGTFNLITSLNANTSLNLGQSNLLPVPIVTNSENPQSMDVTLTPRVATLASGNGYWLQVGYSYEHPRYNNPRNKVIGSVRARFQSLQLTIE